MKVPDKFDTVFRLSFDDPELAKLDVRLRASYGLIDSAGALASVDLEAIKAGQAGPEDLARLRALVTDFSGALVSWNLEDAAGEPLATDPHTVRSLDMTFVLALVGAFMTALQEMSQDAQAALQQAAEAAQVAEAELPMEPLG